MDGFGEWRPMASAPKDGSRVLVAVRASEQGAAEVDVARWTRPERAAEPCWIAADSDPGAVVAYAEPELIAWMPMPSPALRSGPRRGGAGWPQPPAADDEIGGSGI